MGRKKKVEAPEGMKGCNDCLNIYPATSEHFNRDKSRPSGLTARCRKCETERAMRTSMQRRLARQGALAAPAGLDRHVVLFSGGAASWAEARLTVERYGPGQVTLLFADTTVEDEDLYRFLEDAAANIGLPVIRVSDGRTPWQVFRDRRFLGNARVAHCSRELKQAPTQAWLLDHCAPDATVLHFGLDWEETGRIGPVRVSNAPFRVETLLHDAQLTRHEVYEWMAREGLRRPRLYDMGFDHNNCGGACVKAGKGQWAHLLRTMPERYDAQVQAEAELRDHLGKDVAILRDRSQSGAVSTPLSLEQFRDRLQGGGALTLLETAENTGCGCFLD